MTVSFLPDVTCHLLSKTHYDKSARSLHSLPIGTHVDVQHHRTKLWSMCGVIVVLGTSTRTVYPFPLAGLHAPVLRHSYLSFRWPTCATMFAIATQALYIALPLSSVSSLQIIALFSRALSQNVVVALHCVYHNNCFPPLVPVVRCVAFGRIEVPECPTLAPGFSLGPTTLLQNSSSVSSRLQPRLVHVNLVSPTPTSSRLCQPRLAYVYLVSCKTCRAAISHYFSVSLSFLSCVLLRQIYFRFIYFVIFL